MCAKLSCVFNLLASCRQISSTPIVLVDVVARRKPSLSVNLVWGEIFFVVKLAGMAIPGGLGTVAPNNFMESLLK